MSLHFTGTFTGILKVSLHFTGKFKGTFTGILKVSLHFTGKFTGKLTVPSSYTAHWSCVPNKRPIMLLCDKNITYNNYCKSYNCMLDFLQTSTYLTTRAHGETSINTIDVLLIASRGTLLMKNTAHTRAIS